MPSDSRRRVRHPLLDLIALYLRFCRHAPAATTSQGATCLASDHCRLIL